MNVPNKTLREVDEQIAAIARAIRKCPIDVEELKRRGETLVKYRPEIAVVTKVRRAK